MGNRIWIVLLIFALVNLEGPARSERWLQGQVLENHGSMKRPAAGAQVWIVNVGNPYTTLLDGGYRVLVPDAIRIGQTIVLYVKRKGWAIETPQGGELKLSEGFIANILLSPEASPEFLSPAQLDKLLQSLPEKIKSQVRPDGKEGEADPAQVVKEYAAEHRLPEGEVIAKVEALIQQYEQSGGLDKRCLAAVYHKNLEQAATLCREEARAKTDLLKKKRQEVETLTKPNLRSEQLEDGPHPRDALLRVRASPKQGWVFEGSSSIFGRQKSTGGIWESLFADAPSPQSGPAQLEEARRQLIQLTEEVVRNFEATGDVHYANYQFDKGLAAYEEGLTYVSKGDLPTLWATVKWDIGRANWEIGIRTKESAIHRHLKAAIKAYHEAQTVFTLNEFPAAWAALQNNLGIVLRDQGTRTGGEAGTRLLAEAVEAYRAALTVRTKEQLPQQWAMTQNNLGIVLRNQGTRTGGEAGTRLLAEAVEAYRAALEVRTQEHLPEGWAQTHNNLAKAYVALEDWREAAKSYRKVLTLYPDDEEAYQSTHAIYHEKLFSYVSAFDLTKQWVERHPEDITSQADFAEAHLTTRRYSEAERRLEDLLKTPTLDPSSAFGLRVVEIVNSLALNKADAVPQKLRELRLLVSHQPDSFHVSWSFDGTKHYVQTEQIFAPYREWLIELFSVVESKDRATLLSALDRVQPRVTPGGT